MGPPPKPISTLAEFNARLESLQRAADASSASTAGSDSYGTALRTGQGLRRRLT